MDHQFCILHCRAHMTAENKVLVCGFWKGTDRGSGDLLVSLDYTPVKTDIKVQETVRTLGVCEKRYFFATVGYNIFVIAFSTSMSFTAIMIASRR